MNSSSFSTRDISNKKDQTNDFVLFSADEFEDLGIKKEEVKLKPLTEGLGFHHESIKLGDTQYNSYTEKRPEEIRKEVQTINYQNFITKPAPARNSAPVIKPIINAELSNIILAELVDIFLVIVFHFVSFFSLFFITKQSWSTNMLYNFYLKHWWIFSIYALLFYLSYQMVFNATHLGTYGKKIFNLRLTKKDRKILSLKTSLYHASLMLASMAFLGIPFLLGYPRKISNISFIQK